MSLDCYRGRKLVGIVNNTQANIRNTTNVNYKKRKYEADSRTLKKNEDSKESKRAKIIKETIKIEPYIDIKDFGKLWAHPFDYSDYTHLLIPSTEYASSLKLLPSELEKQITVLKGNTLLCNKNSDIENNSFSLLCTETLPSSLANSPINTQELPSKDLNSKKKVYLEKNEHIEDKKQMITNKITKEKRPFLEENNSNVDKYQIYNKVQVEENKCCEEKSQLIEENNSNGYQTENSKNTIQVEENKNNEEKSQSIEETNTNACQTENEKNKSQEEKNKTSEEKSQSIEETNTNACQTENEKTKSQEEKNKTSEEKSQFIEEENKDKTENEKSSENITSQNTEKEMCNTIDNQNNETENIIDNEAPKGRTKTGKPRVRVRFTESVQERKIAKRQVKLEKFSVKPPCTVFCKKKCSSSFTESDRLRINKDFWDLGYESQGFYIHSLVKVLQVNRRIPNSTNTRNNTYKYFFDKESQQIEVCKIFFLTTLGYDGKNDRRILDALKKTLNAQSDKRGKREHEEKIDRNVLKSHIESFRPAIAHYRRVHAPNRRYLPSDLNATIMFKDFKKKYPDMEISYELYRKFLKKDMNISFTHLGNEECEDCESYKIHQPTCKEPESCDECATYKLHRERYTMARTLYQQDVELAATDSEKAFYSSDLQKVIMLPRIDTFKSVIFCPRIIAFNQSFVPLGSTKSTSQPFAAVWHEATSGRRQGDIISAYKAFLLSKRDCTNIVIWADNCSSQNKNWAFFTFLVQMINGSEISTETITIKYLQPGHTFMSADHFHHQVENQMQHAGKVYDFSDFIDCVQLANSGKVVLKAMGISDFYKYVDHSSQAKLKKSANRIYLKDIVIVEVHRTKFNLFVNTDYTGIIHEIDFLKAKYLKNTSLPNPIQNITPRGITQARKSGIIKTISKIMPQNRQLFWQNLPISEDSTDLVNVRDEEDCNE